MDPMWGWDPLVIWSVDGVPAESMSRKQLVAAYQRTREYPPNLDRHDTRGVLALLYRQLKKREESGELERYSITKEIVEVGSPRHSANCEWHMKRWNRFESEEKISKILVNSGLVLLFLLLVGLIRWILPEPDRTVEIDGKTYSIERP